MPSLRTENTPVRLGSSNQTLVLKSDLALILTDLRLSKDWSKRRLARELGINASTLTKLEQGRQYSMWESTWDRIVEPLARLLEVAPDELRLLGHELIAEVVAPMGLHTGDSDVLTSIAQDPNLDEEAKRFVVEAYMRARKSSQHALTPAHQGV